MLRKECSVLWGREGTARNTVLESAMRGAAATPMTRVPKMTLILGSTCDNYIAGSEHDHYLLPRWIIWQSAGIPIRSK